MTSPRLRRAVVLAVHRLEVGQERSKLAQWYLGFPYFVSLRGFTDSVDVCDGSALKLHRTTLSDMADTILFNSPVSAGKYLTLQFKKCAAKHEGAVQNELNNMRRTVVLACAEGRRHMLKFPERKSQLFRESACPLLSCSSCSYLVP